MADEEFGSEYGIKFLLRKHPELFNNHDLILIPDGGDEKGETIEPPGDTFLVDENVYNQSLSDMVNGNKLTEISYDQMQDLSSLKLK